MSSKNIKIIVSVLVFALSLLAMNVLAQTPGVWHPAVEIYGQPTVTQIEATFGYNVPGSKYYFYEDLIVNDQVGIGITIPAANTRLHVTGAAYGIYSEGTSYGGYFKDTDNTGYAYLGYGDFGISSYGASSGGYFKDTDNTGYAYLGYGDFGISAYGTSSGGYFKDIDNTGYTYLAYGDFGISAYGTSSGGYFKDINSSGYAYAGYGDAGVSGYGSGYGGYFSDTDGTSSTYVGYSSWGVYTSNNAYFGGQVGIGTTTLPSGVKLYSYRASGDYGAGKASVYGYRSGSGTEAEGGTSWSVSGVDAAIKGYSWWGNRYTAGVAGYNYSDYALSAGVIGGSWGSGTYWGALGFRDGNLAFWGVYTPYNAYVGGSVMVNSYKNCNIETDGSGNFVCGTDDVGGVTWPLLAPQSAAANPQYSFSGDTNTGMFQPSGVSDTIAFSTGGSERLRIEADGDVGIGTTGPTQKLEVEGGNISIDAWDSQYRGGYTAGGYSDRRMIGGAHGWDSNMLYVNGWNDWSSGVSVGGPGGTSNLIVTGNLTVNGVARIRPPIGYKSSTTATARLTDGTWVDDPMGSATVDITGPSTLWIVYRGRVYVEATGVPTCAHAYGYSQINVGGTDYAESLFAWETSTTEGDAVERGFVSSLLVDVSCGSYPCTITIKGRQYGKSLNCCPVPLFSCTMGHRLAARNLFVEVFRQ